MPLGLRRLPPRDADWPAIPRGSSPRPAACGLLANKDGPNRLARSRPRARPPPRETPLRRPAPLVQDLVDRGARTLRGRGGENPDQPAQSRRTRVRINSDRNVNSGNFLKRIRTNHDGFDSGVPRVDFE